LNYLELLCKELILNIREKRIHLFFSLSLFLFLTLASYLLVAKVTAAEVTVANPLLKLRSGLISFFKDIKATVTGESKDNLRVNAGSKDGILKYMRFDLVVSETIKHPVTKEEIGTGEIKIGTIEIKEVYEDYSLARIIEGSVRPGAKLHSFQRPLRVFLKEEKGVDYFVADDYLKVLKSGGDDPVRFEFVNDPSSSDITIILKAEGANILRQAVQWSDTGEVFITGEVELPKEYLENVKKEKALYEEELKSSDLLLSFRLPGSVRFINIADVDGDAVQELVLATDDSIEVYKLGVSLKGLYEKKLKGELIGLYTAQLNKNNRADIIVSFIKGDRAYSEVYELQEGELRELYRTEGILRLSNGRLFWQAYSPYEGPSGEIKELKIIEGMKDLSFRFEPLGLKIKGIDIYSFLFLGDCEFLSPPKGSIREDKCKVLVQDDKGYLALFSIEGELLWRSNEDTGGAFFQFQKASPSPLLKEEVWSLKERFILAEERVFFIKRRPVAGAARGIGWSSSEIRALRWNGKTMEEETVKEVGGAIIDFSITGDRLYILQKPFMGFSLSSLLKGENPKQTRLYIFSVSIHGCCEPNYKELKQR
jgi:hypothetical protein